MKTTTTILCSLAICVIALLTAAPIAASANGSQEPDWEHYFFDLLDVKFREGTQVRLRGGRPQDLGANAAVRSDLDRITQQIPAGLWQRVHSLSEAKLSQLRTDGIAKSGRNLPDLNLYQRVTLPRGMNAWQAKKILEGFDAVEVAYIVPRPVTPPVAPDYTNSANSSGSWQGYVAPNPGIDAVSAWNLGWQGRGVRVCDVEYGFNAEHQDLPAVTLLGEAPLQPSGFNAAQMDHGTSVLGEIAGIDEGPNAGIKGIAFGAKIYFASEFTASGSNRPRAILECASALEAGDIILLEMQTRGPYNEFVAPEWYKPVYDAIVTAVANEIIVIEASGNGGQDLDLPNYSIGNDGHWPFLPENDSGAIIVTGGSARTQHGPLSFTNWGSAVDLQAWGHEIVTSGAGDHYNAEGGSLLYTKSFGGSSGASPMVVGAAALLQEAHKSFNGTPLSPAAMKDLLVSTGTAGSAVCLGSCPAGSTLVGIPIPNVAAAMQKVFYSKVYVDRAATGANNGTSWVDAYSGANALKSALDAAAAGTQIQVARGTHWPTFLNGVRTANFQLKNGVTLLGGYPTGGGTRDPAAHPTYLSGNISNATPEFTNDSYHVVTGGGTNASAILDGFIVLGGSADGVAPNDRGGGIYINNGAPTIRQSVITNNRAVYGAGVYANGSGPDGAAPRLLDMIVKRNTAGQSGGGVFNHVSGATQLIDVTFHDNEAAFGGGLYNEGAGTNPQVVNNRFYGNTGQGAAVYNNVGGAFIIENAIVSGNTGFAAIANDGDLLQLNNVTIAHNTAYGLGSNTLLTVKNSIVWGNTSGQFAGAAATVSDSIVQGGHAGTNVLNTDPLFRDADGADNVAGTPDDDLRLQGAPTPSPAIDTASVAAGFDCVASDIEGNLRNNGVTGVNPCDMGAHEYLGGPGSFWSNGEADRRFLAESFDETPVGGPVRHSADDFVVPAGQICQVSAIRAVLHDPTPRIDAIAQIFADASGQPGSYFAGLAVGAMCADSGAACTTMSDCATPVACTGDSQCTAGGAAGKCINSPNQTPPFSGTVCTYVCAAPGRSLGGSAALDPCLVAGVTGACASGRLWEYEFAISPPLAFAEGTHWVSVFGTVEAGSTGQSYWVSAGDDSVRANSYRFREQGTDWVDGGPFYGSIARDLALEIDAVCAPVPPPNNGFGSASAIGASGGSFAGTLASASNDGSTSGVGSDQPDVWYRYTAPAPGMLRVNTCGSNDLSGLDTALSVHTDTGVTGSAANQLALNNDWAGLGGDTAAGCPAWVDSAVAVPVAAGDALLIRVSRYSSASDGAFSLNVTFDVQIPANDHFADAIAIGAGSASGTLFGATIDGDTSGSGSGEPDVWYTYTAPASGTLRVNTCGSEALFGLDTVLSVHADTGVTGSAANELAVNDDWASTGGDPDAACPGEFESAVVMPVGAGDALLMRISRYDSSSDGDFIVNVSFEVDAPDTDGDGVADNVDNCILYANADQRDSNSDGFGNRCDADLNDDCIVNPIDLGMFRGAFFGADPHADLNGDGVVNPIDLGIFRSLFFQPPGPSGAPNGCP